MSTNTSAEHSLRTPWRFSYQAYGPWEMTDIVIVYSVEQFWIGLEHMPQPSLAFRVSDDYDRPKFKHGVELIRCLCLRRDSIVALEWEDVNNKGMYRCDVANIDKDRIDALWEISCLSAVGEALGENVNAVRIIDRGKKQTINTRVEIWCKDSSREMLNTLKQNLPGYVFSWVDFESLIKSTG